MRFFKWFFSGEVLFSGFLVGYVLNSAVPSLINLMYIFMFLSFLVLMLRLLRHQITLNNLLIPATLYTLLVLLMAVSLSYSHSKIYAIDKLKMFITLTTYSFFGVIFLIQNSQGLKRFLQGIIFFSFFTAVVLIIHFFLGIDQYSQTRVGIGGEDNVISSGRITGLGAIVIIVIYIYGKIRTDVKYLSIMCSIVLLVALLLTATRMPFIALIISILLLIPFSFRLSWKKMTISFNRGLFSFILIAFLSMSVLVPLVNSGMFDNMFNRMEILSNINDGGTSVSARITRFEVAMDMFFTSPIIGQGIGSFPIFFSGMDHKDYAHNIFLEILSELGLIGFILFFILLGYACFSVLKYRKSNKLNTYQIALIIMGIYLLINANASADINGNRLLFSSIALICMIPSYKDNIVSKKTG